MLGVYETLKWVFTIDFGFDFNSREHITVDQKKKEANVSWKVIPKIGSRFKVAPEIE